MITHEVAATSPISWIAIGACVASHLWQSTLFAVMVALFTLLFRKNHARVCYWLWLAASVKFLLPFSLLVVLGNYLARSTTPTVTRTGLSVTIQEIGQPFAYSRATLVSVSSFLTVFGTLVRFLPVILLLVWLGSSAAVLFYWWWSWRGVASAVRVTSPLGSGREFDALLHVKHHLAVTKQIELVISEARLEPGVLGIFRAILFLPEGISERLTDAELEAVIAHELCHVRRQDNLTSALHMLVEALFWFHPLIWWMGARLVHERERACDEEVLRMGSPPEVYAESILKVCQFYLDSPLFCVSGVTSSNLKRRIEVIMANRPITHLNWSRKIALSFAVAVAVLGPIVMGFMNPPPTRAQSNSAQGASPEFELVSLQKSKLSATDMHSIFGKKEDGIQVLTMTNVPLSSLLADAYDLDQHQVSGGPDWVNSERYDMVATMPEQSSFAPVKQAFQKLLSDRFKVAFHYETRDILVYELVVGQNGPKLTEVPLDKVLPSNTKNRITAPGHWVATQLPLSRLSSTLALLSGRPVIDKTGLTGSYSFTLDWAPDLPQSMFSALGQQLGLKLNARNDPLQVLLIDHAERPTIDEAQ
jgi:uncharacterized protein (TIGR03435 family)